MSSFEWDDAKNLRNQERHGIAFEQAQYAFLDEQRLILYDAKHSDQEQRWFCIGKVQDEIVTVRFTHRGSKIRIIGAGTWRKWRQYYEQAHE